MQSNLILSRAVLQMLGREMVFKPKRPTLFHRPKHVTWTASGPRPAASYRGARRYAKFGR